MSSPGSTLPREHVLLEGISWKTYARMRAELDPRPIRLTYDDGSLEIEKRELPSERIKKRLGRLVAALTELSDLPLESAGSTTWQREDLQKGLEPDECWWIQNAAAVRHKEELDLRVDPPPDLAVEVDLASSSLDRMRIHLALGIPEVWRWKNDRLTAHVRDAARAYVESPTSLAIPGFVVAELGEWVVRARGQDETAWIRAFREWVRGTGE